MLDFTTEVSLDRFLQDFATCSLRKEEWTHDAHVAVATCYLLEDRSSALTQMRTNIRRFNESVGGINSDTSGYHETLTVFWLNVIAGYLDGTARASRLEAVWGAVREFGTNSKLHAEYYRFDVVNCTEARRSWIAPDREPLLELI